MNGEDHVSANLALAANRSSTREVDISKLDRNQVKAEASSVDVLKVCILSKPSGKRASFISMIPLLTSLLIRNARSMID